jgi:hypothetical protein
LLPLLFCLAASPSLMLHPTTYGDLGAPALHKKSAWLPEIAVSREATPDMLGAKNSICAKSGASTERL